MAPDFKVKLQKQAVNLGEILDQSRVTSNFTTTSWEGNLFRYVGYS
jgi:hypothetical protein